MAKSLGKVWVEIHNQITRTMCWLHNMIHLATVTLQESTKIIWKFVKGGPKLSLRLFLHQALHL